VNPHKQTAVPVIERPAEIEPGVSDYDEIKGFEPRLIVWLRLLWSERRFLARVTVYGIVLATLIALILPPRYESTVRLMPPDEQSSGLAMTAMMASKNSLGSMGGLGSGLAAAAGDLLGLKNSTALFADILSSRTIQDRMIQRFDLRKEYGNRYWQDARKNLAKNTDIAVDRKSDVMAITVTDRDPQRVQQMAQAYVEELNRLVSEVSTSAAGRERIFIEQRLQTVKQDLDRNAKEFSEYESKNTLLDMPYQAKAMVEAAAQLQGQLIAAQSELEGLEQVYTPNNVRVRSVKARVDELKNQLAKMHGTAGNADSIPDGESSSGDLYPSIRKLPLLGVHWLDLYRETKVQETVYELLTQQYELAKVQEAKEIPTVKVLDTANLPERKSFPKRTLIVELGTLFAFSLGVFVVLASAKWREIDPNCAEKRFLTEIWARVREWSERSVGRGSKPRAILSRLRNGGSNGSGREQI
jgi:capsule polysaccharide export protein KpsE/RkpR